MKRIITIVLREYSPTWIILLIASCTFSLLSLFDYFNLFLSFSLLFCTLLYSILSSLSMSKKHKVYSIMSGNFLAICTLTLLFLVTPTFRYLFELELPSIFARRDWQSHYSNMNLLVSSAVLALKSGEKFQIQQSNSMITRQSTFPLMTSQRSRQILFWYSSLIVICLTYLYAAWVSKQGGWSQVVFGTRALRRSIEVDLSNGYALDSLFGIFGILTFWYFIQLRRGSTRTNYFLLLCVIPLVPSLATGNRFFTIYYTLVLVLISLSSGKRVRKSRFILALVILSIVVTVPREYRGLLERPSPTQLIGLFSEANLIKTISGEDLAMAPGFSILLANEEFINTRLYGMTYLQMLTKPIPRSIWQGKPTPLSNRIMVENFPDVYKYTGFAFSALCEPYINFGFPGVIVFFFILGFVWQRLYRLAVIEKSSWGIYFNAWIASFAVYLMRGDLSIDIQRCAFPLIVSLVPIFLLERFHKTSISKNL